MEHQSQEIANTDIDTAWKVLSEAIVGTASVTVGVKPRNKNRRHWYDTECERIL